MVELKSAHKALMLLTNIGDCTFNSNINSGLDWTVGSIDKIFWYSWSLLVCGVTYGGISSSIYCWSINRKCKKQGLRIHWQKISTASLKNSSDGVSTFIQLCVCVWGGSSGIHCLKWVDSAGQLMIRTTRAQLRRVGTSSGSTRQRTTGRGTEKYFSCFSLRYLLSRIQTSEWRKQVLDLQWYNRLFTGLATEKYENLQIWSNICLQLLQILKWACFS